MQPPSRHKKFYKAMGNTNNMGGIFHIDLSSDCDLGCFFCYQNIVGTLEPRTVIEHINSTDAGSVGIGGGEPRLYEPLPDVLHYATSRGKTVDISTNGTAPIVSLLFLPQDMVTVQVSVPTLDEEVFRQVTGKDMLRDVLSTIDFYKEHFPTTIHTTVTDITVDGLEEVIDYARDEGLPAIAAPAIATRGDVLIGEEGMNKLRNILLGKKLSGYDIQSPLLQKMNPCRIYEEQFGIPKGARCSADLGELSYLSPAGSLHACQYLANMGDKDSR